LFASFVLWGRKGLGSIQRKSISEANKQLQLETNAENVLNSKFNFKPEGVIPFPSYFPELTIGETFGPVVLGRDRAMSP
jgi:hypothetical protein